LEAPKERTERIRQFAVLRVWVLCRRDIPVNSVRDAIGWWEARRIAFNLIVGTAGILSCIVVGIVGLGSELLFNSEFGIPNPPGLALIGVIIYGILANLCFTGGWVVELVIRRIWPQEADRFATMSFSLGLIFSILLTLSPAVLVGTAGIFKLLNHFRGRF
jgi:hypothetical protein